MIGYHTAENREIPLYKPLRCTNINNSIEQSKMSWLGAGYYFWKDFKFAKYWGQDHYKKYDIYKAELNTDNCLDTVFNEKEYNFFIEKLEEIQDKLKKAKKEYKINVIIELFKRYIYKGHIIDGIIFADTPTSKRFNQFYPLFPFKRIQIVIYNSSKISYFKKIEEIKYEEF